MQLNSIKKNGGNLDVTPTLKQWSINTRRTIIYGFLTMVYIADVKRADLRLAIFFKTKDPLAQQHHFFLSCLRVTYFATNLSYYCQKIFHMQNIFLCMS